MVDRETKPLNRSILLSSERSVTVLMSAVKLDNFLRQEFFKHKLPILISP